MFSDRNKLPILAVLVRGMFAKEFFRERRLLLPSLSDARFERRRPELARLPRDASVVYGSRTDGMAPAVPTAGLLDRRLVLIAALAFGGQSCLKC